MAPTRRNQVIGQRVAEARQRAGLSQAAVAEAMRATDPDHQWSQATVWSVEKGDRPLRAVEVEDLARILEEGQMYLVSTSPTTALTQNLVNASNSLSDLLHPLLRDWSKRVKQLAKAIDNGREFEARAKDVDPRDLEALQRRLVTAERKLEVARAIESAVEGWLDNG